MNQLLGAHTSISGGVSKSVELAEKLGFTAMQIFTKNNNRWFQKKLDEKEINLFKSKLEKSRKAFLDELERCDLLGISHLNFHPGAHLGSGEEEGIKRIAESLNIAHEKTKNFKVSSMLESTAGQGTTLGYKFEQLRKIIDLVEAKERMSVCIDTAHVFASGYDIKDPTSFKKVIKAFDEIIGLERLKCFHMNDSKKPLGSKVDRHEHIGKGFIGLEGFKNIMNDKRLTKIPKILETPKGKEQLEDLENLKVLKSLIKN